MSELAAKVGMKRACEALGISRSSIYRARQPQRAAQERQTPAHGLSLEERVQVRETLNSERFMDKAPRQVYAALLDEGQYLCHWRTMYRVLAAHNEVRERRHLRRHPYYLTIRSLNSWPRHPIRFGRGTSPICVGHRSGSIIHSTPCLTSTVVTWLAG